MRAPARRSRRRCVLAAAALTLAAAMPAGAASFPPHLRFRSVSTPRVVVHYHQGIEAMAREAAAMATEILEAHEARYRVRVRPKVQIVLADVEDDPNGFATPVPYPLVHIRVVAPDGTDEFGNYEGWLRLVLTHELAHVVHLEQARGLLGVGRKLFGRAPFLFPNALTPTWMLEGLATYEETEATAFGRGRNPDARMVLRMAALEGDFLKEDRPVLGLDRWPAGQAAYLFGEAFVRDLTRRFGAETLPNLARVHSGRVIPYADDLTSDKVTGASFHARWREWAGATRKAFEDEAQRIRERGLTESKALTSRGIRQTAPRFSPDGAWIAYTSRTLTRFRAIRLVRPDGSGDRKLTDRNGGLSLSWMPDGRGIVYDEPEIHRLFATYSDLRVVDVATGRTRRLTRGLRAKDPDVSRQGLVAFVRQYGDRSELAVMRLDGKGLRDLTRSAPGTQWSLPRWSPQGEMLVASRWTSGGWLDIVRVDPTTGISTLTDDRAKDVEPAWTPDGRHVIFRSDRDGVSNLYALRLEDGALLRVTNVLGGAFRPDVSPDGRLVTFASYSSRGYDVHVTELDLAGARRAGPFVDANPAARPPAPPVAAPDRPYRPLPALLPRFWSPYVAGASNETRFGAVTGGADPLLRHAFLLDVHRGNKTERVGFRGFYQYDRFRPTFLLEVEDDTDLEAEGTLVRTQRLMLRASIPVSRSLRRSQNVSIAWRRERETVENAPEEGELELGGIELAWAMGTARQYPYSISPVDGYRLRLAILKEDPAFGSDVSLAKLTADARAYVRLFGEGDVLALRAGGGTTRGRPTFRRSFAVGGFPDGTLFDVVRTNHSVLRGYPDSAFTGRSFAHANLEYRIPLAHPQRGIRLFPVFFRHLHATVFADAAHAWTGRFRMKDVKTAAGAALGADVYLGHALPLTGTVGLARGFAEKGETRAYFRLGLAF